MAAAPDAADSKRAAPIAIVAALLCVYILWGATYYAIRVAIDTVPPLLMAGVRFLVAGAILFAVSGFRSDRRGDRLTWPQWRSALVIGAALLGVGNGGVTLGEERVASGTVALLVATVPLWLVFFDWIVFKRRISMLAGMGVAIGLLGVGLLLRPSSGSNTGAEAVVLLSPMSWAAGSLYARGAPQPRRQLVAAAMEMVMGGAVLVIAGLLHGEAALVHLDRITVGAILAFGYLVFLGSIVAYSCYVWLLHLIPTRVLGTYAYVNPLVAVSLGTAFLGESISAQTVIAGALIVGAVALILAFPVRPPSRPPDPQEAASPSA